MTTAAGQPTSALYGLCVMLLKLLREEQPLGLAFALDGPTPTFRHAQSPDYKAQRPALADPLREQLRVLPQLLDAFGAPCFCVPGFEADDVLATLAVDLAAAGQRVRIVTGDRDLFQIVRERIDVMFVGARGRKPVIYDRAAVERRYGLRPEQLPSRTALAGDVSDNLPKVPGIGERGAEALVRSFGDVHSLLSQLSSVTPTRLREALERAADQIRSTEALARLRQDVPLPAGPVTPRSRPTAWSGCARCSRSWSSRVCCRAWTVWRRRPPARSHVRERALCLRQQLDGERRVVRAGRGILQHEPRRVARTAQCRGAAGRGRSCVGGLRAIGSAAAPAPLPSRHACSSALTSSRARPRARGRAPPAPQRGTSRTARGSRRSRARRVRRRGAVAAHAATGDAEVDRGSAQRAVPPPSAAGSQQLTSPQLALLASRQLLASGRCVTGAAQGDLCWLAGAAGTRRTSRAALSGAWAHDRRRSRCRPARPRPGPAPAGDALQEALRGVTARTGRAPRARRVIRARHARARERGDLRIVGRCVVAVAHTSLRSRSARSAGSGWRPGRDSSCSARRRVAAGPAAARPSPRACPGSAAAAAVRRENLRRAARARRRRGSRACS